VRRVPWALAALPALALARLLPGDGAGLWFRLLFATAVLLVPGALIARALRQPAPAATFVWSVSAVALGLLVVFLAHTALWVAFLVLGAVTAAALPLALRVLPDRRPPGTVVVVFLGLVFGIALWHVAGALQGDALFHLARVRKLDDFGDLHLRSVAEFHDGGLHPGYAFPLWHGFLALVAKLAGADPAAAALHEPSVLAPLAFGLAYEAGYRIFSSVAAALAALAAQVALIGLAPGRGGSYVFLAQPPTASRQLLVPAVLALAFAAVERRSPALLAGVAAGALALALIHPTYAVFLCLVLGGYAVARTLLARAEVVGNGAAVAALAAPALAVALWVFTLARTSASLTPGDAERRRALRHYASQLDVFSLDRYRLAPEVVSRGGAIAVAALVLVPLAVVASRRRWAALVLGASTTLLVLVLVSFVFPHFADVASLSQARRAAGFIPFAFAFAGGALVLAGVLRVFVLPLALGAGIALQLLWPGDFGYGLRDGGPAVAAWIALYGGAAALVVGAFLRRRIELRRNGLALLAAFLFVLPVAVNGFWHWTPRPGPAAGDLTPGLIRALRTQVGKGDTVFSDPVTSYRIAAYAPVYVASAPPFHVADTRENRRFERAREARIFFRTGALFIPRRYGASWIVLDRRRSSVRLGLPRTYSDGRFLLYRLAR
jgi:hypothetical protein